MMKKSYNHIIKLIIVQILFLVNSYAQYSFNRWDSISVSHTNTILKNPWAGGLNFPQFSSVDLDGNGVNDLFVVDRSGNKILTFINKNIPDSSSYFHQPEYEKLFPEMQGWVLLADYNNDGLADIFTSHPKGGVTVFRNDFSFSIGLKFTVADSLLKANFGANKYDVYVSPWDIPAITDVDDDGDIDILAFNTGGMTVTFYKNISIENFGIPDSLVFEIADVCWGKFEEWASNCNINLGISCKGNISVQDSILGAKHAGSTLLALDLDGDDDKELLIGDLICNNISQLTNGGNLNFANMIESNKQYPFGFPVNIRQFPAAFFLDVNNDGKKDLLAAPSAINISENFESAWLYKNNGTNSIPQFEFQSKSFLQSGMIDVGEGANPAFFDEDGDGLQDMFIGNYGYHKTGGAYVSSLALFRNTGTKTNPSFELITRDYADISSLGLLGVHPCFGDIDGDGDLDMLLGESQGKLFLFTNTAEIGKPANFVLSHPEYKGIDVGQFSAPQLADVNRNGKLDLLIGERNGNINYFENTGTKNIAEFTLATDSFGKVNVRKPLSVTGYSVPLLVELDTVPGYSLLVGTETGEIFLYKNIDENLTGDFLLVDTFFQNISEGIRAAISASDLNDDGNPDLIVGNYRGGVAIYKNNMPPRPEKILPDSFSLQIFPNPVSDNLIITIPEFKNSAEIFLFNILGQIIYYQKIKSAGKYFISAKNFAHGIYFASISIDETVRLKRKIVFVK